MAFWPPPPGSVLGIFMKKVNFYIDGFNLYHNAFKKHKVNTSKGIIVAGWPDLRWQDLYKLMEQFINPKTEIINTIYYFSAIPDWIPSKAEKHQNYIKAVETRKINIILGKFKEKHKTCPLCKGLYISHEEKESDVNIAINLLSDVLLKKCDIAYLVSGDSDMVPSLKKAKSIANSQIRLGLILPPYQKGADLKRHVDFYKKITRKHLTKSLLPYKVEVEKKILCAPKDWLPSNKI